MKAKNSPPTIYWAKSSTFLFFVPNSAHFQCVFFPSLYLLNVFIYISQAHASVHMLFQLWQPLITHSLASLRALSSTSQVSSIGLVCVPPQPALYSRFPSALHTGTNSFYVSKPSPDHQIFSASRIFLSPLSTLLTFSLLTHSVFPTLIFSDTSCRQLSISLFQASPGSKSLSMLKAVNHNLWVGNH